MLRSPFKKTIESNRGAVIVLAVSACIHLLLLGIIIVATTINPSKGSVAAYFTYITLAALLNLWVMVLYNITVYTTGYSTAVGAGMTRRIYLRNARLLNLIYIGVLFLLSVCGSLVCLALARNNPAAAKEYPNIVSVLISICSAQIVLHLFYAALGLTVGWLILRIGMKMVATSLSVLSIAVIFISNSIETFIKLAEAQNYLALALVGVCFLAVSAVLSFVGRAQLKRINI